MGRETREFLACDGQSCTQEVQVRNCYSDIPPVGWQIVQFRSPNPMNASGANTFWEGGVGYFEEEKVYCPECVRRMGWPPVGEAGDEGAVNT